MQMTWFLSGLGAFFFFSSSMPMSARDLQLTGASLRSTFQDVICATFMPTSASFVNLHPRVPVSSAEFTTPQSSRWDEGLSKRESELLRCGLTWLWAYGKSPREWKKAPLSVACSSFQLILWPVSVREEPNKHGKGYMVRVRGQKQTHSDGPTGFRESEKEVGDRREPVVLHSTQILEKYSDTRPLKMIEYHTFWVSVL